MKAISGCQVTFTAKIDSLQIHNGLIWRDMEKFRNQLTDAECHLEDTVRAFGPAAYPLQQGTLPGIQSRECRELKPQKQPVHHCPAWERKSRILPHSLNASSAAFCLRCHFYPSSQWNTNIRCQQPKAHQVHLHVFSSVNYLTYVIETRYIRKQKSRMSFIMRPPN